MKKDLEFKSFEIKAFENKESGLTIEGYAAYFGNVDSVNDIIQKGAFAKTLKENKDRIAFCYQHDIYKPIGKINEIEEDEKGLFIKARISDSEDEIKTKIREGILKEMSIGFQTVKQSYDEEKEIRTLHEVKLWEASLVTIAANSLATITGIKSIYEKFDIVNEMFDNVIEEENDRNKKYNLLKLKSLVNEMPEEPQVIEKPIDNSDELKSIFYKTLLIK